MRIYTSAKGSKIAHLAFAFPMQDPAGFPVIISPTVEAPNACLVLLKWRNLPRRLVSSLTLY